MNNWPPITVLVYTYSRPEKIRHVLAAFKEHLRYSGELIWRIADDGSPNGYLEGIAADFPELELQWTVTDRKGFGANANKGLRAVTTKYVFASEDDKYVLRDIDLDTGIRLMEGVPTIGALRYDAANENIFLSGHIFRDSEPPIFYWIIDRQRSKHWNPCGHPTLIQPDFYGVCGYLPEGVRVSETEQAWTRRASKMEGPDVAILLQYIGPRCYVHLGGGQQRLSQTERDAGYMIELGRDPKGGLG